MYRRDYTDECNRPAIPDEYGGTSLSITDEREPPDKEYEGAQSEQSISAGAFDKVTNTGLGKVFSSFKGSLPFLENFGIEELLIIAVALFLLFSKEKDIECALILIASIFIT